MTTRMPARRLEIGDRIGARVVVAQADPDPVNHQARVMVQCDCNRSGPKAVYVHSLTCASPALTCQSCSNRLHERTHRLDDAATSAPSEAGQRAGLRLRYFRLSGDGLASEVAGLLDVSLDAYWRYEQGALRRKSFERIAALLGITVEQLRAPFTDDEAECIREVILPAVLRRAAHQPQRRAA